MRKINTRQLVQLGLLAAISIVLVYLIRFPIFLSDPYLEYDMADVPILIGGFLFGPVWGLLLTAVVSVLQWLLVSQQSGWVGAVMHFCASGAFVLTAAFIYRFRHERVGALIGLIAGALGMVLVMIPLNLIFTVHFLGAPRSVVEQKLLPVIIPFNAIKAFANAALTFLLYKPLSMLFKMFGRKSDKKLEE